MSQALPGLGVADEASVSGILVLAQLGLRPNVIGWPGCAKVGIGAVWKPCFYKRRTHL